jgi:hypothetical protein
MPLLWDIDLFINDVNGQCPGNKYTLCEINVSGVSPFPPSCIPYIINELKVTLIREPPSLKTSQNVIN